jgi:hypothetical protein
MRTPSVIHVVLVRWTPEVSRADVEKLEKLAGEFPDTIPGVLSVHCGQNSSLEGLSAGFDWALVIGFASTSARDDYLPHPAHRPVAALISRLADQVVVFDVNE